MKYEKLRANDVATWTNECEAMLFHICASADIHCFVFEETKIKVNFVLLIGWYSESGIWIVCATADYEYPDTQVIW